MNIKIIKIHLICGRHFTQRLVDLESSEDTMDTEKLAKIAHALSDPTRLRIFEAIAAKKEVNCSDLTCQHDVAPGTVSHHLKTLSDAGLIESRREGQFIYNRAIPRALAEYAESLVRLTGTAKSRKRR